ncbi:MAG: HD domain-containing protein [Desulfomonilaceae bacterium]
MKCPGQDPRYWKFDAIFDAECPSCGSKIEFFKDETRRKCKNCGEYVLNPKMDFGCAAHCKFAKQCFGDLPPELIKQKEDLFKDRVAVEMKMRLKNDFKRIGHASRVASMVERLIGVDKAKPAVLFAAAYLHDVEPAVQGANGDNVDQGDKAVARDILEKLDAPQELIEEVCSIIKNLDNPKDHESGDLKLVHDAHLLASLQEKIKKDELNENYLSEVIDRDFLTDSGRSLAYELFPKTTPQLRAVTN